MVVANSLKGCIVVTILRVRVDLVYCLNIDFFRHLFIITPNKSSNASLVSIKENLIEAFLKFLLDIIYFNLSSDIKSFLFLLLGVIHL